MDVKAEFVAHAEVAQLPFLLFDEPAPGLYPALFQFLPDFFPPAG
jgi:ABC-type branched-subunit amino acid transport system ATPase component